MIIVIGGPTAVGKSELACITAKKINGEIISADSMMVYKYMDIGTDKPKYCMHEVKHYLIDLLDPGEYFDAKMFEIAALMCIERIKEKGKVPLVVGGSYLYIQALLYSIADTPEPDWNLRVKLYRIAEQKGSKYLYEKLRVIDPEYAEKIHPNDLRRIVRALEVFVQSGRKFSSYHNWSEPRIDFIGFCIMRSWENIVKRIEDRVRRQIEQGLVEEVKKLMNMGFERFLTSSQAIGYKELIPYIKGEKSLEECVKEIIKNTKEFARRQIRWFKKQNWIEINLDEMSMEEASNFIIEKYRALTEKAPAT